MYIKHVFDLLTISTSK